MKFCLKQTIGLANIIIQTVIFSEHQNAKTANVPYFNVSVYERGFNKTDKIQRG